METQITLLLSCTALTVLVGLFVLGPLFRGSANSLDMEFMAETERDRLMDRKMAIYGNLKDLAFEYEMRRLSDEDFRQLEADYKTDAAVILHKLEQLEVSEHLDESSEKDIATEKKLDQPSESIPQKSEVLCPFCGGDIIHGKNFCADCGHEL